MSNIRINLLSIINSESKDSVNYSIAVYILENLQEMKWMTNTILAKNCNVSKASISRFSQKLGYEDYFQMQLEIATYIAGNSHNMIPGNALQDYIENITSITEKFIKSIDYTLLTKIAIDIKNYKHVVLMGQVQSSLPALSLQHNLTLVGKYAECEQDIVEQLAVLNKTNTDTLVIIFSSGGKFFDRVLKSKKDTSVKNGPKIYYITASESEYYQNVYQSITLQKQYGVTSNIILNMYADLIFLQYRNIK